MMTTTHALVGATVGATLGLLAPELAGVAILVGFVAGALPDADLLWTHRRTTHFPFYAPLVALVVVAVAALVQTPALLLAAVAAVAFAVHPVMDALGGGVEPRPWEATSSQAVYDHHRGRWIRPRRFVRYAGAPEDLLLAAGISVPAIVVATDSLRTGLLAAIVVSAVFVAVRRRITGLTEWLFDEQPN